MTFESVMRRVEDDLSQGHTFVAIQRLTTLVQANPKDLDLRSRLAAVHLETGNFVEAGRWGYLADDRDGRAVAAFEKAFRHSQARVEALRWPLDAEKDPPSVQAILTPLHQQAEREAAEARRETKSGWQPGAWIGVLILLSIPVFFLIGVVTFIQWVWPG